MKNDKIGLPTRPDSDPQNNDANREKVISPMVTRCLKGETPPKSLKELLSELPESTKRRQSEDEKDENALHN